MSGSAKTAHYLGVVLVFVIAATMLAFYASGRLDSYLSSGESTGGSALTRLGADPDDAGGWDFSPNFRLHVLIAGCVLCILGAFNLLTANEDVECLHDHDHDPGDDGCCGHDHHHDQSQSGTPDGDHTHDHDHKEGSGCCGHEDHHHDHAHHDHGDHGDCGHDHHDHGHHHAFFGGSTLGSCFVAAAIIAFPLTLAAVFTPDQYSDHFLLKRIQSVSPAVAQSPSGEPGPAGAGADSIEPEGGKEIEIELGEFTLEDLEAQVDRSPAGNFMLEVPELFYTAGDREVQRVLEGQPVETVAQIMPERLNNDAGNRVRLFRLVVECCAADARPLSILPNSQDRLPNSANSAGSRSPGK